ncbi:Molybdopterin-guanine dinucleotide biosynthesis protein A [Halalkaliarchaeum sp. AArc-CO]|uniref:molybdenum cofactor guanylyltransferase n=1 Tax=unclassified Halalkaliarchaeum TaxID=2678344 RepID=UPI00217E9BD9|nr:MULTISPECIES: molybdenum cofactor guanylyltransferase [unclassified Halalkaliarchaeum]MDR5673397.1 molybdenum cofactor guanylyltransferase [Halalkaliarchaeum sp. AArc-GB]UWG49738.1 Molybdopterin-guanine dinucleotide biosynthesis protein A [Halalkaliarchaeum sp. AArc-CO]
MDRNCDGVSPGDAVVESIILAGGFSRRFGDREKLTADVAGEPMIRRVVRTVEPLSRRIVASCRREQRDGLAAALGTTDGPDRDVPVSFAFDDRPDGGPLAGLASAIDEIGDDTDATLVFGGDFPLVKTAAFETLLTALGGEFGEGPPADAALPSVGSRLQPLCAACRTDALRSGVTSLEQVRNRAVLSAFDPLSVRAVPADQLPGGEASFRNVNTPTDLREITQTIEAETPPAGTGAKR